MSICTVKTKEALQQALKNKIDVIEIVDEDLSKKIDALKKARKITRVTLWILGGMAAVALGGTILTGGTAAPAAVAAFATTATAATGLSEAAIVAIVTLGCATALGLIGLMRNYDLEWEVDSKTGKLKLVLKRKTSAKN